MKVIDLFSGLGGASEAFRDRGHDVTRYDIDPKFADVPDTSIGDVFDIQAEELVGAEVILAGIDCTNLTYANHEPKDYELAVRLAQHTMTLIEDVGPSWYCIENPLGSRLWDIIGPPTYVTEWGAWGRPYRKPTGLKGRLPVIDWPMRYVEPMPSDSWDWKRYRKNKFAYLGPREASKRSLWPYEFSLALCIGMEHQEPQPTIEHFLQEEATPAATPTASATCPEHDASGNEVK